MVAASGESEGRVWLGPMAEGLDEQMARWKSIGHYFLHKLGGDLADTLLFTDFDSGREWTGGQLSEKILNVACALVDKFRFEPGTVVCISHDNSDHSLILALAVICAGGTVACSYPKDPYAELLYLARKVEPRFLFCHERSRAWADRLAADLGRPVRGVSMGADFRALLAYEHSGSRARGSIPVACGDLRARVALIAMSSGTSGKPKAVAQTHWNAMADMFTNPRRSGRGLRFACCASLDYVSGRIIMFGCIHLGYHTVLLNGFQPATYLAAVQRFKVGIIYVGAAAFYNLIAYEHLADYDISSVRCVFPMGAKIIYLAELRAFFRAHPHIVQVRQGYGSSEISGGAMNSLTPDEYLRDCENCGHLLPGMRAKIVDPASGRLLGPNERGILHLRGETVFPGYYDMEVARERRAARESGAPGAAIESDAPDNNDDQSPFVRDAEIFDSDGYYISGDWAYFTEREELYCIGRQKEMMSCRGAKKVLPAELETIIDEHPAVAKVCVLGVANRRELTLHCPRAFVVPRANYYTDDLARLELSSSSRPPAGDSERQGDPGAEDERLEYSGASGDELRVCRMSARRRHLILVDLMRFVDERVGWEKRLTGGLVLLDDIPTSRATGKFDKNYLRSLRPEDMEIYGDRSGPSMSHE